MIVRSLCVAASSTKSMTTPASLRGREPHDAADPLLVDAAARRRGEVHADRRARRVPALGEQLRVDEDVDLSALVRGERLGEPNRRRAPADGLSLEAGCSELPRKVVGVLDACGIDDAGRRVEAIAVQARGCLVEDVLVEDLGQDVLVVVPAHDRDGGDRGRRPHAQRAEGRDQPAPRSVPEREIVHGSGEDVGHLLGDQVLRRGHADVDRLREAADRRARLLTERRVRLVADDELVGGARERVHVPREPRVGLDRERVRLQRLLTLGDRGAQAVAVALCREVARELVDQQAAVGENEDAHRPRGLDEARGGDRLAGGRRVAEAVAAHGARVVRDGELLDLVAVLGVRVGLRILLELLLVLVGPLLEQLAVPGVAVRVPVLRLLLVAGDQLGEHARERVDLVAPELRAGGEAGGLVREDSLQAEHERVLDLPLDGRRAPAGLHLGERGVERTPARAAFGERLRRVFARVEERLAGPSLRPEGVRRQGVRLLRLDSRVAYRFLHARSAIALPTSRECARARLAPTFGSYRTKR